MNSSDFWKPWEQDDPIDTFDRADQIIKKIHERQKGKTLAWRGAVNAKWPLHSSLYRRLALKLGSSLQNITAFPDEKMLAKEEYNILKDLREWGLLNLNRERLSILSQLAILQHYGAPTRLIDISFNPYVALWFAVEKRPSDVAPDTEDARLFIIDVTDRLINEKEDKKWWEDVFLRPWENPDAWSVKNDNSNLVQAVFAWKPPKIEARIAAQNGGFLLAGVPHSDRFQPPKSSKSTDRWKIKEFRSHVCLPLRFHKIDSTTITPEQPAYTIRIKKEAKKEIREKLESLYGYTHSTMYPDYPGFSQFAASIASLPSH